MIFSSGISLLGLSIAAAIWAGSQLSPRGGVFPLWQTAHLFWNRETTCPGRSSLAEAPTATTTRRTRIKATDLFIMTSLGRPVRLPPCRLAYFIPE